MRIAVLLLVLLPLAACDSVGTGRASYDLAFYDGSAVVARLRFDRPTGEPCDAIGCGSGFSDWYARDTDDAFLRDYLFGERRGTLYAQETGEGYRLTLHPGIADAGIRAEIAESASGRVDGQWSFGTLSGELGGGRVDGRIR